MSTQTVASVQADFTKWATEINLHGLIEGMVEHLVRTHPDDPVGALIEYLEKEESQRMGIKE